MDQVQLHSKMAIDTKEISIMVFSMVKANLPGPMELYIRVNLQTIE